MASIAYDWAMANQGGVDTLYNNINNFLGGKQAGQTGAPTLEQTQAAMQQYGVSPEDIFAATGKSFESFYPQAAPAQPAPTFSPEATVVQPPAPVTPAIMPTVQGTLPADWGKEGGLYDTAQKKIDYFNANKLSADQLRQAGVPQSDIDWMLANKYTGGYDSGIVGNVMNTFGTSAAPQMSGILSGFEAMNRGDFDEATAKSLLGEDKFGQYKKMFGDETKRYTDSLFADKSLSGQEAIDFMQQARKYGLDADKFAELTGYKKDLFNTLQSGYDTTVNNLVDKALSDKVGLGDRIKTGLALQSKYGLTDEDLAKATDISVNELKGYLDPVRNFESEYKAATSKADVSGKDILNFLDTSRKNESIKSIYGGNLDAMEQKLKDLESKWSPYGVDGYQAENIYNQINKITNAAGGKNWTGSWGSGGDNAAKEAAKKLVQKGVDNLTDLKVEKNYEPSVAAGEYYNGQRVQTDEYGNKFFQDKSQADFEGNAPMVPVPQGAKTTPGKITGQDETGTYYEPLTEDELKTYDPKTGKFNMVVGNKLIDASSGKVISKSADNNFVIDSYSTGNFFKNKDKTMGIMMTDKGVPVPYQTTQKGGLLNSPVLPVLASMLLPGVGSAISSGLAGLGGSTLAAGSLANAALTQGIMSGGMSALSGGDIGKSFLSGMAAPIVSGGISSLLPTGLSPDVAKLATNVGSNLAMGAITGQPVNLQNSLVNAGLQYGAGQLPLNLTPQQVNLMAGVAAPLLQGQSIDPTKLSGILANYAIKSQQAQKGAL